MNKTLTRFCAALAVAATPFLTGPLQAADIQSAKETVLVELYTSQGCYSCPPAEAFLHELADREHVIALEFHVDYWDYIGWKDPFAKKAFTNRQRGYRETLGSRYVYTPQMVIDGSDHAVGSDKMAVELGIRDRRDQKREIVLPKLHVQQEGENALKIEVTGDPQNLKFDLLLATYDREHTTEIERGENRGKTLTQRNIVRDLLLIQQWRGERVERSVRAEKFADQGGWVVLLQVANQGPVVAAVEVPWGGPQTASAN